MGSDSAGRNIRDIGKYWNIRNFWIFWIFWILWN
jgi:hypothetical protein